MRVTFVGGPIHGTIMELDPLPDHIVEVDKTGLPVVYRRQVVRPFGRLGARQPSHAWFAPLGTKVAEFNQLRKSLVVGAEVKASFEARNGPRDSSERSGDRAGKPGANRSG